MSLRVQTQLDPTELKHYLQRLIDYLNAGIIPVVPRLGSVSASGDLAPLSHIALGLMGRGMVEYNGCLCLAKDALKDAGIEPLQLDMKEGLAPNSHNIVRVRAITTSCAL